MKLQDFLTGSLATILGLSLSRILSPGVGYPFAHRIADFLSSRPKSALVYAVRANQWLIHQGQLTSAQLDALVVETFRSSARSMYEFWHFFRNPRAVTEMVELDPSMEECLDRAQQAPNGTLLVAPHVSNFDLVGRAIALRGLKLQILSYPRPPAGYRWQNQLRQIPGMMVTPMSIDALRKASETLRAGRIVFTGIDRPLPIQEAKYLPRFFGRPAAMPVFYIRLALKHNLPITVIGVHRGSNGRYKVWATNPIPMRRSSSLMEEIVQNTETVLNAASEIICKAPEQWAMFYPVWPDVMAQPPA